MLRYTDDRISHTQVSSILEHLQAGDVVVVNDTKVRPARLELTKSTGGKAEVLLLEPTGKHNEWQALVKPGKRLPVGTVLYQGETPLVEIVAVIDERRLVKLLDADLAEAVGKLPLPPYIHQKLKDQDRYQTVYANRVGSAAAPTAGLHFTAELLEGIQNAGVEVVAVDLQVGIGTFKPISVDSIEDHIMHSESYEISPPVWDKVSSAKRVIAIGTTVVRTLESAAATNQLSGATELFISRGFDWKVVDLMLTNFHVPESSLLVMIDAFVGPVWKDIYSAALDNDYRFLSLGDCMLLDRAKN